MRLVKRKVSIYFKGKIDKNKTIEDNENETGVQSMYIIFKFEIQNQIFFSKVSVFDHLYLNDGLKKINYRSNINKEETQATSTTKSTINIIVAIFLSIKVK